MELCGSEKLNIAKRHCNRDPGTRGTPKNGNEQLLRDDIGAGGEGTDPRTSRLRHSGSRVSIRVVILTNLTDGAHRISAYRPPCHRRRPAQPRSSTTVRIPTLQRHAKYHSIWNLRGSGRKLKRWIIGYRMQRQHLRRVQTMDELVKPLNGRPSTCVIEPPRTTLLGIPT